MDTLTEFCKTVVQPPATRTPGTPGMRVAGIQNITGKNRSFARYCCREGRVIVEPLILAQPDDDGFFQDFGCSEEVG